MEIKHYGKPRLSGRYPWGSGENPYQRTGGFLAAYKNLKSQGLTDAQIAKAMGMTTLEMRARRSISNDQQRAAAHHGVGARLERGFGILLHDQRSERGRVVDKAGVHEQRGDFACGGSFGHDHRGFCPLGQQFVGRGNGVQFVQRNGITQREQHFPFLLS